MMKAFNSLTLFFFLILIAPAAGLCQSGDKRLPLIIPIEQLVKNFEVIYGDPEAVGEPFVMRIRELPGTIIPPHQHPVDEHIPSFRARSFSA